MIFSIQPHLENERASLLPLQETDFESLYAVASDPEVWEQHPNKDRYQKAIFQSFFEGAMKSQGAFKIICKSSGEVAGSTRFYDYNEQENSILIGYTFYGTKFWGKGLNTSVKNLMLTYIFQYVDTVILHVGATNKRSQIAVGRLGAIKVAEQEVTYYGEKPKLNFIYALAKKDWETKHTVL